MNKKIITIAVIIWLIISTGFSIYALGWKSVEKNLTTKGAKQMLSVITNNIKQVGKYQIDITDKEGKVLETIILVPQTPIQITPQIEEKK